MSRDPLQRLRSNAAFLRELVSRQLEASFALRAAFWTSAVLMVINDLFYFSTWTILFHRFGEIGGWRLPDMMCLYAVSATGFGLCVILAGGIHELSRRIDEGDLDTFLTQPKHVLIQALASRTVPSGWGDVSVGLGLLVLSGNLRLATLPAVLLAVVCSCITFIACGVVMHSLAFWLGRTHTLSRALWEFTILFSLYPPALFGAGIRFFLFIVLPAAIAVYLPVDLVRNPSVVTLLAALAATASYAAFALWLFERGLRRYASGNRITTRA